MILVLNKIDLAPPALVVAWKNYFKQKYPEVHIVMFTSFPKDSASSEDVDPEKGERALCCFSLPSVTTNLILLMQLICLRIYANAVLHKRKRRRRVTPVGPRELYEACESIVQGKGSSWIEFHFFVSSFLTRQLRLVCLQPFKNISVNLSSWEEKIEEDLSSSEASAEADHEFHSEDTDSSFVSHEQFKDGILTVGCCGEWVFDWDGVALFCSVFLSVTDRRKSAVLEKWSPNFSFVLQGIRMLENLLWWTHWWGKRYRHNWKTLEIFYLCLWHTRACNGGHTRGCALGDAPVFSA